MKPGRVFFFAIAAILSLALATLLAGACAPAGLPGPKQPEPLPPDRSQLPPRIDHFEPASLLPGQTTTLTMTGQFPDRVQVSSKAGCHVRRTIEEAVDHVIVEVTANADAVSVCRLKLQDKWKSNLSALVEVPVKQP